MALNSKIEWTDHTFNPWIGCTKVSPGCLHCYAERDFDLRKGRVKWGNGNPRSRTSADYWKQPLKWNRDAANSNARPRVFCASLADWLDDEVPIHWLADLLALIFKTPNLDWLLLTKRPENWEKRLRLAAVHLQSVEGGTHVSHPAWRLICQWLPWNGLNRFDPPANIWIGTSVEDQERADQRIPELLKIPARVRFLSCEPLLGPVNLMQWLPIEKTMRQDKLPSGEFGEWYDTGYRLLVKGPLDQPTGIHWVIAGGESGPQARIMRHDYAITLRDQCLAAGVSFLFKQWGEWMRATDWLLINGDARIPVFFSDSGMWKVGKKSAGRLLDGQEHNGFPKQ